MDPVYLLYVYMYLGRHAAHDVAAFAKDSSNTPVTVLSPRDFPDRVITGGKPWFVDFYAPVSVVKIEQTT